LQAPLVHSALPFSWSLMYSVRPEDVASTCMPPESRTVTVVPDDDAGEDAAAVLPPEPQAASISRPAAATDRAPAERMTRERRVV
jgi:hypothetical protein